MARSDAQRKREERARKQDELKSLPDSSYPFLADPFFLWLQQGRDRGDWEAARIELELAGFELREFKDDSGPQPTEAFGPATDGDEDHPHAAYRNSVGRAEALLDNILGAATCLAAALNKYKREQLLARLKEMEVMDLPDPEARKMAFEDAARLKKMLEQLEKTRRVPLAEWRLKGF
jgi:hypothetical protein